MAALRAHAHQDVPRVQIRVHKVIDKNHFEEHLDADLCELAAKMSGVLFFQVLMHCLAGLKGLHQAVGRRELVVGLRKHNLFRVLEVQSEDVQIARLNPEVQLRAHEPTELQHSVRERQVRELWCQGRCQPREPTHQVEVDVDVVGNVWVENLDGDFSARRQVRGAVHLGDAAAAERGRADVVQLARPLFAQLPPQCLLRHLEAVCRGVERHLVQCCRHVGAEDVRPRRCPLRELDVGRTKLFHGFDQKVQDEFLRNVVVAQHVSSPIHSPEQRQNYVNDAAQSEEAPNPTEQKESVVRLVHPAARRVATREDLLSVGRKHLAIVVTVVVFVFVPRPRRRLHRRREKYNKEEHTAKPDDGQEVAPLVFIGRFFVL
eukprot:PhM_4_TR8052/c0_g1_i1/m.7094